MICARLFSAMVGRRLNNMCGSKCAWCKDSMPTESGGWKCKYSTCQLTEYEITQIILRLAGTRKY